MLGPSASCLCSIGLWVLSGAPGAAETAPQPCSRLLALRAEKPQGLKEKIAPLAGKRSYGQFSFGASSAPPVTVVVDELSQGRFAVYVDQDRDGTLDSEEKLAGDGPSWSLDLKAAMSEADAFRYTPRKVRLQWLEPVRMLGMTNDSRWEGEVNLGGRAVKVRRIDANANGLYSDPADRLWIDVNGDNRWDGVVEQFPFAPQLRLRGKRYRVAGDPAGPSLTLTEVQGSGRLTLQVADASLANRILAISAQLAGRDGTVLNVNSLGKAVEAPVGDYRLVSLAMDLRGDGSDPPWRFEFAEDWEASQKRWQKVGVGQSFVLDPVQGTRFTVAFKDRQDAVEPGARIDVLVRLKTESGLTLTAARRGESLSLLAQSKATVALETTSGQELDQFVCGIYCGTFCPATVQVPAKQPPGPLRIMAEFDSGPLGGKLRAENTLVVK